MIRTLLLFSFLLIIVAPASAFLLEEKPEEDVYDPAKNPLKEPFDHSVWDQFLKKFVNDQGQVDYLAVKNDPSLLNQYLEKLKSFSFGGMRYWPREEVLALKLNAYHAGLIKVIAEHYPVKSVQEIPGIWDQAVIYLGSEKLKNLSNSFSLNQIRGEELIEAFGDEKIHLALSCGAVSCPPMAREAFVGPRVEGQLFIATRKLVNHPDYVRIDSENKTIWLSLLFKWYAGDFILDFGNPEALPWLSRSDAAVISFIAYYIEDPVALRFLEEGRFKIKYLPFDWRLNEAGIAAS